MHPLKDLSNDDLSNESKENEITYEKAWMNIGVILLIVLGIVQKLKVSVSLPLLVPVIFRVALAVVVLENGSI